MKLSIFTILSIFAAVGAFAPTFTEKSSRTVMNAEQQSRKAFFSAAGAAMLAGAVSVSNANAGTMGQENVKDVTEQWETGKPTKKAETARMARYTNARNQMTSSFPPQKRLTLERKSPVTRLDINAPDFTAYKNSYPGLFKTTTPAAVAAPPAEPAVVAKAPPVEPAAAPEK